MLYKRATLSVIGLPIDAIDWASAVAKIITWAENFESRIVCICNTHSLVTARNDEAFASIIRSADMATPDGAPVAWHMRLSGAPNQQRINGPDLMWRICAALNKDGAPSIYLYGNTESTNALLIARLHRIFPKLIIAGQFSPPFRTLTKDESASIRTRIIASRAGIVWASLGCPKQEAWMQSEKHLIPAVLIGVGAAFDYHAGTIKRAPRWMQKAGLEWLHRLSSEPRRLWRRYLYSNSAFLLFAIKEAFHKRL